MLLLLPAALCCLCSGECFRPIRKQCDEKKLYWFQKKHGQPFEMILQYNLESEKSKNRNDHPDKDDFSILKTDSGINLIIATTKAAHSATYYCACYKEVPHNIQQDEKPQSHISTSYQMYKHAILTIFCLNVSFLHVHYGSDLQRH
uniref:Ig-like domain-containing protein n=1 Tax=Sphaeramia orbicularis TaxID=375764 RepID=A0A672YKS1_9TELE